MASDTESVSLLPNGTSDVPSADQLSTPDVDALGLPPASQAAATSLAPTEVVSGSPIDSAPSASASIKAESDDRLASPPVIPSSLTPPPHPAEGAVLPPPASTTTMANGLPPSSQTSSLVSPPATVPNAAVRRPAAPAGPYVQPLPAQIRDASADEVREMLDGAIEELGRVRGELAGWKFRVTQLTRNEEEYAERHHVELRMMYREIEALCEAERLRQMSQVPTVPRSVLADYEALQQKHRQVQDDYKSMQKKLKAAKKVIQEKDELNAALQDDKDMLLNRLKENREHAQQLMSPGKILHPTPKSSHAQHQQHQHQNQHHHSVSTPQTSRAVPRDTPRSAPRAQADRQERFTALLSVLQQEGNSAPPTPQVGHHPRPPSRPSAAFKGHTRNVQSMSSIPTTPKGKPRGEHAGLLPSVDLVPRTEPRYSNTNPFRPINAPVVVSSTPPVVPVAASRGVPLVREKSRESTISADEEATQELARQALRVFNKSTHLAGDPDARESADATQSSSRDGTPAAPEKTARMHAKPFPQGEKRKHDDEGGPIGGGGGGGGTAPRRGLPTSPKRVKLPGLGIRDGR